MVLNQFYLPSSSTLFFCYDCYLPEELFDFLDCLKFYFLWIAPDGSVAVCCVLGKLFTLCTNYSFNVNEK